MRGRDRVHAGAPASPFGYGRPRLWCLASGAFRFRALDSASSSPASLEISAARLRGV